MKAWIFALAAAVSTSPAGIAAAATTPTPKEIVLAFYKLALMDYKPKEAFAKYAAPDFVEHSPDTTGGTAQSTVAFLSDVIRKSPQRKWEIVRAIAEGDMVFLHVRFSRGKDTAPIAVGEIFRVANGRLAEHWDIIEHAPAHPTNRNSMF